MRHNSSRNRVASTIVVLVTTITLPLTMAANCDKRHQTPPPPSDEEIIQQKVGTILNKRRVGNEYVIDCITGYHRSQQGKFEYDLDRRVLTKASWDTKAVGQRC